MAYLADTVITALRGCINLGVFFRLGTNPPLHLWMGMNDIPIGIPSVDPSGTIYNGAGRLLGVDKFEMMINGLASTATFSLSGVDPVFTAELAANAPSVVGAVAQVGIAPLDARWQPLSQIIPLWIGTADFWSETKQPVSDSSSPDVRTISLSTSAGDTMRARQRLVNWTDSSHQTLYPGDLFCSQVSRYNQTYQAAWPRF